MPRLRRSDPAGPGWTLLRRGTGFELFDTRGRKLSGEASRERVAALAIPPAWQDVWISPSERGHIQATGVDAAGRRQYLYHPVWTVSRSRAKFRRMGEFAAQLGPLRETVEHDLSAAETLERAAVLGGLVRLLDIGFFRVGSERYAAENRTFGLTTLLRAHATVRRDGTIVFDYVAKHGKRRVQRASDDAVGELVARLKRRRSDPNPRLFAGRDDDRRWAVIRAGDLNGYLQDVTGTDTTAKDFRTWNGTVLAAAFLAQTPAPPTKTARNRVAADALRQVADALGNTLAVTRSSYVDPRVVDRWRRGDVIDLQNGDLDPDPDGWSAEDRRALELAVIELLDLDQKARAGARKAPDQAGGSARDASP